MAATFGIIHRFNGATASSLRKDGRDRPSRWRQGPSSGQISSGGSSDGPSSLHSGSELVGEVPGDSRARIGHGRDGPPEPPEETTSRSTARCPSEWAPVFQIGRPVARAGLAGPHKPGTTASIPGHQPSVEWAVGSRISGSLDGAPMMVGEVLFTGVPGRLSYMLAIDAGHLRSMSPGATRVRQRNDRPALSWTKRQRGHRRARGLVAASRHGAQPCSTPPDGPSLASTSTESPTSRLLSIAEVASTSGLVPDAGSTRGAASAERSRPTA